MTVTVVGGGAAGMMAAISAAENGNIVTLVEKNDRLGKKLFLTGKGRCNITNACPVEELFDNIVTNRKFLYSSVYSFDNEEVIRFFNENGLKTKTERGNRVFPQTDHSSDVIAVLKKKLDRLGVKIMLNTEAVGLERSSDNTITSVIIKRKENKDRLLSDAVIMATGGRSYPLTGSDGTAFLLLEKLDIPVNDCEPSLGPLVCKDADVLSMRGLSLKNVSVSVAKNNKELFSGFGEMLFTHFGLSGPLILSASAFIRQKDYKSGIRVIIDLKPALSYEELDRRILKDFEEFANRDFSNSLQKLLPNKIISPVIKRSKIDPHKKVNMITRQERKQLCDVIKCFSIPVIGTRGFDEAIITRGGVDIKAVDPSTMRSRSVKGLYFAGEMLDLDAQTGGFNLQIAWSTGHLAGECR